MRFSCKTEIATHLFEGATPSVSKSEPELEHSRLTLAQGRGENVLHLLLAQLIYGCLGGRRHVWVLKDVSQVGVLIVADVISQGRLVARRT